MPPHRGERGGKIGRGVQVEQRGEQHGELAGSAREFEYRPGVALGERRVERGVPLRPEERVIHVRVIIEHRAVLASGGWSRPNVSGSGFEE